PELLLDRARRLRNRHRRRHRRPQDPALIAGTIRSGVGRKSAAYSASFIPPATSGGRRFAFPPYAFRNQGNRGRSPRVGTRMPLALMLIVLIEPCPTSMRL